MLRLIIICFILIMPAAHAKVILNLHDKINTYHDIDQWSKEIKQRAQKELSTFKNDADGYTECRETIELPDVYLCGTYLQRDMNALLMRATIHSDGYREHPKGSLVTSDDLRAKSAMDILNGHDIPSDEFAEFYKKVDRECSGGSAKYCLTSAESIFRHNVIKPLLATHHSFVIIAYSVQSLKPPNEIVSHEMYHAKYFRNAAYRKKIQQFWQSQITKNERTKIESVLSELGYDKNSEDTMINEFQAYVLQAGSDHGRLEKFSRQYKKRLESSR